MHGGMEYMSNHFAMRLDPRMLHEGTKTVISLTYNYFPQSTQPQDTYQIAKYAYGQDYHEILKPKLHTLLGEIAAVRPCTGRVFTDSAPILEREWARRAGLDRQKLAAHKPAARFILFFVRIIARHYN